MRKFLVVAVVWWVGIFVCAYMVENDLRRIAIDMQESRPYAVIGE